MAEFIRLIGARIRHGTSFAGYLPDQDLICLPHFAAFESPAHYFATSLHECCHWSGYHERLNRDLSGRFGSQAYAAEELIAELAAAFLCSRLEIPGRLRHAEYIGEWLTLLGNDTRAVFTAASKASEAADYLCRVSAEAARAELQGG